MFTFKSVGHAAQVAAVLDELDREGFDWCYDSTGERVVLGWGDSRTAYLPTEAAAYMQGHRDASRHFSTV